MMGLLQQIGNDTFEAHRDSAQLERLNDASFLSASLSGAGVGTWQVDIQTGLATWDATTSAMLGLEPRPMTSDARLPVRPEDFPSLWASIEDCSHSGAPHDMVFRAIHANGEVRWFHSRAQSPVTVGARSSAVAGIVLDITERKIAQDQLRERERELSTIIANLPGVAYRCAVQAPWIMSFISTPIQQLTGYSAEDFTSGLLRYGDLVHPDDYNLVVSGVDEAVENRTSFEIRYRLKTCSGYRWVLEKGQAAYARDGQPLFLEGFIGDIHDQVLASEALKQTEERYRLATCATGDLVWDWDLQTDHLTWSDALQQSFGYEQAELGSSGTWWKDRLHPSDRDRVLRQVDKAFASADGNFASEYRFRRSDGSYAEIFDRGFVILNDQGRPVRMVGAMQDLTERNEMHAALQESENLNRSILEASADCIKIINADGTLELMNAPGACALDLPSSETVRGRKWAELWPRAMQPTVAAAVQQALKGETARFSGYCPTARGIPKWWDVVVTPMTDGGDG
jgi:PAS domain S-box-containing protein